MNKWQIARYLIDAKKEIDSLWFIAVNANKINGNLKKITENHRNSFYINAASVVDKLIDTKGRAFKKTLCAENKYIDMLFYFRDKHSAHKDEDFKDKKYNSIMEIVNDCIKILKEVRIVSQEVLPDNITLDFVCYDQYYFRNIYKIDKETEERINYTKYPFYNAEIKGDNLITKKIFNDTEDLWQIDNKENYCTVLKDGLTMPETLQNKQDWCIKTNVLYNKDIWITVNAGKYRAILMMIKLGYVDVFNRFTFLQKSERDYEIDVKLIEDAERYNIYNLQIDDNDIMNAILGK